VVGGDKPRRPTAGEGEEVGRLEGWEVGELGGTRFDDPGVVGEAGGEVEGDFGPVWEGGLECRWQGGRVVDDDKVAGVEEPGEVHEGRVDEAIEGGGRREEGGVETRAVRDEEADFVAGEAAGLGWLVGLELLREEKGTGGQGLEARGVLDA
jgi:hypothetical protein